MMAEECDSGPKTEIDSRIGVIYPFSRELTSGMKRSLTLSEAYGCDIYVRGQRRVERQEQDGVYQKVLQDGKKFYVLIGEIGKTLEETESNVINREGKFRRVD